MNYPTTPPTILQPIKYDDHVKNPVERDPKKKPKKRPLQQATKTPLNIQPHKKPNYTTLPGDKRKPYLDKTQLVHTTSGNKKKLKYLQRNHT